MNRQVVGVVGAALLMVLAGCAQGDSQDVAVTGDKETFDQKVDELYADAVAEQKPQIPGEAPEPVTGKKLYIIPCAMAAEGCARPTEAQTEAAELLGWSVTVIDPGGDPAKVSSAVTQATAEGADAIVLNSIDPQSVLEPLRAAREEGIKVVSFAAGPNEEGEKVIDYALPSTDSLVQDGYLTGVAAYKLSGGDLKAIMMHDAEYGITALRKEGFEKFVDECAASGAGCEILGIQNYLIGDLATKVPQQTVSLAQRFPNYTVLWDDYDASLTYQLQGLEQSNLIEPPKFAVSFDANSANLDDIRSGGSQKADLGLPMVWVGYAVVDQLNRLFQDEPLVEQGVETKLLVEDNVPASGAWDGDVDVRPLYRELWGK